MNESTRKTIVLTTAVLVFIAAAAFLVLIPGWNEDSGASVLSSNDFDAATPVIPDIQARFAGVEVGEPAPAFTLLDTDGNEVTLADFAGQPVMINFWATWCAPCRVEMPEMQAVFEEYEDQGFVILALNQDESAEMVEDYFTDMNLTFTPLLDINMVIANDYGAFNRLPSSFFIDGDGIIAARHIGAVTADQIEENLVEILPPSSQ